MAEIIEDFPQDEKYEEKTDLVGARKRIPGVLSRILLEDDQIVFDAHDLQKEFEINIKDGLLDDLRKFVDVDELPDNKILLKVKMESASESKTEKIEQNKPSTTNPSPKKLSENKVNPGEAKIDRPRPGSEEERLQLQFNKILKNPEHVIKVLSGLSLSGPLKMDELSGKLLISTHNRPLLYEVLNHFAIYKQGEKGIEITSLKRNL